MQAAEKNFIKTALEWYIDQDIDSILGDEPINRFAQNQDAFPPLSKPSPQDDSTRASQTLGASQARIEAIRIAQDSTTLEELQISIADFDGIALKKTATNMVFSDGNAQADIMLIGEAPAEEEDREGKPFCGIDGVLLDKILACIDIQRFDKMAAKSVYLTNFINWRPPGNRPPSSGEIEVSLPFIERHIQLIQPKLMILCGSLPAKALLGKSEGLSRLRKKWHDYTPQTPELAHGIESIPAIVTYHPAYLLRTPSQKRAVWSDMRAVQSKLNR